ncbi:MAG TPA: hypothetical protein VIY73_02400 [Polyangiaceae bacterium]
MARVWQRLASAVFCVGLVIILSQCKGLKPTPGAPCVTNGRFQCTDSSSAMLCQNGKYVSLSCRGPRGCRGVGASSQCDDDLANEGDACMMTLNDNYSCSVDHGKEFICKNGIFTAVRTCKGPKKCTVTGDMINCDDSLADVGDVCVVDPGDANYACSTNKQVETVCDAATSKFLPSNTCRGPKGCWVENQVVHCDMAMARVGDKCRPVDNHSCSEDATQELKCSPQFTWTKQRDCKHGGCKVKSNEVYCD